MWRKLLIALLAIVVALVLVVAAINVALVENDMAGCDSVGGGTCAKADVIVVVSGGDTTARTQKAIDMYRAGWADKLVFSGASADPDSISNAEAMRQIAIDNGIPDGHIYLDENSRDTRENAQNVVEILHRLNASNVILVSSPYHLRRVKMNFMSVDNQISYRTMASDDKYWRWWFVTPNGWVVAVKELAGIAQIAAEVQQ